MPKERLFIKAKLPQHIKAIHIEFMDDEMQSFNFANKPKDKKSQVKTRLIVDGFTVHTNIIFTPTEPEYTPHLTIEKNGTERPN